MKTHTTLIAAAVVLSVLILGCSKKREVSEELQEPMSMTSLTNMATEPAAKAQIPAVPIQPPQSQTKESAAPAAAPATEVAPQAAPSTLEALPPSGPYKPSAQEIQSALKNAGFYTGAVDGKAGPLTKKAIEEFQKANNMKVDGKVGPQTWALLGQHLTPGTPAPVAKKKR